ncbi:hypothetical protein AFB00_28615 [Pseudonocardia sp. HH130630-07]|nr:hypothetical protein AFB00_28615 [Pseudonocardia sp. HH130630-07]
MRTHAGSPLPDGLTDQWKRWERGRNRPDEFYRPLIAAALGTVVESLFPEERPRPPERNTEDLLLARSGMGTDELVERLRRSALDTATLDALAFTVEQFCCGYARRDPLDLLSETRRWLSRVAGLLERRTTFAEHRDLLDAAGQLTLLAGCLEYDAGRAGPAEATRRAALALGTEAGNPQVTGWAHEMRAWFALTGGRHREVIDAAHAGQDAAPGRSVAVQLHAQEAKAWARIGDRRNVHTALEQGRSLLDALPAPDRPDHHFVVDPQKYDFYAMDCHRLIGDDALAGLLATEVLRRSGPDGCAPSPMRAAEAEITLAVVAARRDDLDAALVHGTNALDGARRSAPSLRMVGTELATALEDRFPVDSRATDFRRVLDEVTAPV